MKSLNPTAIAPPFARYSHGVEIPPNARLLRCSGQLGLAADGTVPPDPFDQAVICFNNIRRKIGRQRCAIGWDCPALSLWLERMGADHSVDHRQCGWPIG